jgi:Ribosomal protein L9, N-terminal domain
MDILCGVTMKVRLKLDVKGTGKAEDVVEVTTAAADQLIHGGYGKRLSAAEAIPDAPKTSAKKQENEDG